MVISLNLLHYNTLEPLSRTTEKTKYEQEAIQKRSLSSRFKQHP